ncbi:spermidine/putrescine ABC transporter ATP-binding protein PotA [Vibrio gazogenes]|uniref:Spermidine/putrescine import ATP-binding protein PotA n=1 Tax=Vibrio gazogenes DSM 21264 = NBRC 103151 TaxID=1123492 RepID=A0A1M4ZIX8_VIBGA|nr:spermidine/putrescine ABC transporter ATP-binding protein PotA [Vibrio gazogenes]SHF18010.1 spermidine/putrescine transport system ATP-binding protein [Vibrio gazogenes DSM 21264] [Vibrio gazogenes DSM 21264 = NBRC 103151]
MQTLNAAQSHEFPVVSLVGMTKSYDGKKIIDDFSLQVNHGEFLTILGPSGCGKTTILRMIAGFESADQGNIFLDGQDVTAIPAEHRNVNTVFQSYALFPHMTVFDNVAFGLRMRKVPTADIHTRVFEVLKMVRLDDYAGRKPHQLSGGQQQRVAIARAMVNKPKVLLLDESLSALDYKLRQQMQVELKQLQRQLGITFIFVTHDQEEALSMSDRIIVMRDGNIEQDGTPKAIYEDPKNLFVARFIGEINVFEAVTIERVDDKRILVSIEGTNAIIDFDKPMIAGQQLQVLLRPEDIRLKEVKESDSEGITGHVIDRTYKGMTLDSVVELSSGLRVMVSEFFNEDDPDVDHSLGQKVVLTWVESWEVVLDENASN